MQSHSDTKKYFSHSYPYQSRKVQELHTYFQYISETLFEPYKNQITNQ